MTRRHLALIGGALLLSAAAINAPAPVAEAAAGPATNWPAVHVTPPSLQIGDRIFRLRVHLCESCGVRMTVEIRFPTSPDLKVWRRSTVNHLVSAA